MKLVRCEKRGARAPNWVDGKVYEATPIRDTYDCIMFRVLDETGTYRFIIPDAPSPFLIDHIQEPFGPADMTLSAGRFVSAQSNGNGP